LKARRARPVSGAGRRRASMSAARRTSSLPYWVTQSLRAGQPPAHPAAVSVAAASMPRWAPHAPGGSRTPGGGRGERVYRQPLLRLVGPRLPAGPSTVLGGGCLLGGRRLGHTR